MLVSTGVLCVNMLVCISVSERKKREKKRKGWRKRKKERRW